MDLISKKFDELTKEELYEILRARAKIFVVEQNICYLDMDDIVIIVCIAFLWKKVKL